MAGLNEVNALLGRGSEFEGKLTFEGTVRIDGRFSGEIFSDDTLIIGESAHVEAEIRVDTVIIYGEVVGNVHAANCVELHAPARLRGNIITPNLQADKGVVFDGAVKMRDSNDDSDMGWGHESLDAPGTPPASPPSGSGPSDESDDEFEEPRLSGPHIKSFSLLPGRDE